MSADTLIADCITETIYQITALGLGTDFGAASTDCEIYKGRAQKPGPQSKKISINVYAGDPDTTKRSGTTGQYYFGVVIHIKVRYSRMDKVTGETLGEKLSGVMLAIWKKLHQKRPGALSTPIQNFYSTEAKITDIDTESGEGQSEARGVDKTAEGYATVLWEFWRPNP